MKVKALLFDLGKVVIDFNFELGTKRLAGNCGLPTEEFEKVLFDKAWIRPYERGEISTAEYHRHLCEDGQLRISLEEFHDFWSSIFLPNLLVPEALLSHLHERYPLILVSNSNESHVDYIARNYNVFKYFDAKIFSHVVGSLKPDRKIYDAAITASGQPAEALFFTDDREENIQAARGLGIRAHQFTSVPLLVDALRSHGVEVADQFA